LSIARSPNAAEILPHLVVVTFTNRAGGRNANSAPASAARGKFATGSANSIQSRLLRHNSFVLHELLTDFGHYLVCLRRWSWSKDDDELWQEFAQNQTRLAGR